MEHNQPIGLDEIKRIEFDLLVLFAAICDENDLRYYLAYGTLLGAVRHKGFIPWDDDIDVLMPRRDYLHLIEIIEHGNYADLKILSIQNEKDYIYPIAKLNNTRTILYEDTYHKARVQLGVNIDIFPMDGLPDNRFQSLLLFARVKILKFIRAISNEAFPPNGKTWYTRALKTILALLFLPIGYKRALHRIERLSSRYDYDNSKYVACIAWGDGPSERIAKKYFEGNEKLSFEGKQFRVPTDYDRFLRNIYGDYMQLPPEHERKSKHKWRAFWK